MSELNRAQSAFNKRSVQQHLDIVVRNNEVQPEFHYHGFWPEPDLKDKMIQSITRLLNHSPANSNVRARMERIDSGFRMYLLLTYAEGCKFAVEQAQSPRKVMQKTLDVMYLKINEWRRERFIDQYGEEFLESASKQVASASKKSLREFDLNPKVLIVDDNPVSIKLIESCLKQQGCTTVRATSAQEAVQKVTNDDFDLVVLDWQMQEMNGGEILLHAQDVISYDSTFRIPWVTNNLRVVTYSGADEGKILIPQCENFDIVGHIPKSATYTELRRATSDILESLRAA